MHPVTLAPVGAPVRLEGHLQGGWVRTLLGFQLALGVSFRGGACDRRRAAPHACFGPGAGRRIGYSPGRARDRVVGLGHDRDRSIARRRSWMSPRSGRVLRDDADRGRKWSRASQTPGRAGRCSSPRRTGIGEAALVADRRRRGRAPDRAARCARRSRAAGRRTREPAQRSCPAWRCATDGALSRATPTCRRGRPRRAASSARTRSSEGARAATTEAASHNGRSVVGPHTLAVFGIFAASTARSMGLRIVDTQDLGRQAHLRRTAAARSRCPAAASRPGRGARARACIDAERSRGARPSCADARSSRSRRPAATPTPSHGCGRSTAPTSSTCAAGAS